VYKKQKEAASNTTSGLVEGNVLHVGERPKSEYDMFLYRVTQIEIYTNFSASKQIFWVLLHLYKLYK
jgi:hypothetical protein